MIDLVTAFGVFAAGGGVALVYLGLLRASVWVLARGGRVAAFLGLAALRGAWVLGSLWLGITHDLGAVGLLVGLAGFVAVRVCVLGGVEMHHKRGA